MGRKWLAIGAIALVAVLAVLWHQLQAPSETPVAAPVAKKSAAPVLVASAAPIPVEAAPEAAPVDPGKPQKLDPQSDEFFYKHDEVVIPNVMKQAVKCWEGLDATKRQKFHRNQSMVINFKQKIVNGTVTMYDAKIDHSSWNDPALESCFFNAVLATSWHDDTLPDWDQEDQIKISARTLKKYTQENINYVGPEAPKVPTLMKGKDLEKDFDPNFKE